MPPVTTDDLITATVAAAEMGISFRGMYRCLERAEEAGETVRVMVGGSRYVLRSALPVIRKYYYSPKDMSEEALLRRAAWAKRASDIGMQSPNRGRRKRAATDDGGGQKLTLRDMRLARAFVNECGSFAAAIAAVEAVAAVTAPDRENDESGAVSEALDGVAPPAEQL